MIRKIVRGLFQASSLGAMLAIALFYCPQASAVEPFTYLDQLPSGYTRLDCFKLWGGLQAEGCEEIETGIHLDSDYGEFTLEARRESSEDWYDDRCWVSTWDGFGVKTTSGGKPQDLACVCPGATWIRVVQRNPKPGNRVVFKLLPRGSSGTGNAQIKVARYDGYSDYDYSVCTFTCGYSTGNNFNKEVHINSHFLAGVGSLNQFVYRYSYTVSGVYKNNFVPCRDPSGKCMFYDTVTGATHTPVHADEAQVKAYCWTYQYGTSTSLAMAEVNSWPTLKAANTFSRTGYTLSKWNTNAAGTGTDYNPGTAPLQATGCRTLYAKWTANNYTASFNMNGGSGSVPSVSQTYDSKLKSLTTSAGSGYSSPYREGYRFMGFYDTSATTGGNQLYTQKLAPVSSTKTWTYAAATILYARWAAGATITINRVQQRYPWNGKVDVNYTLSGVDTSSTFKTTVYLTFQLGDTSVEKSFEVTANGTFNYVLDDPAFDGKMGSLCVTPKVLEVLK